MVKNTNTDNYCKNIKKEVIFINREKMTLICLASCAILSLSVMTVTIAANNKKPEAKTISAETYRSEIYILREYNGKLAVFNGDDDVPSEIFDVYINSFGEVDRNALYKGITAYSEEELSRLIEDYTS
ncbi:MAG: BofC C-terminal domain-containing protein [Oscillospiraceae bacterium]